MSWEVAFADMCRACMKVDGNLLHMYDDEASGIKNLPHKLAELTSIQIDKFDGLPNMLCVKCAYRTNAFYDFKLQVQATEKKLRDIVEAQQPREEIQSNEFDQMQQINEYPVYDVNAETEIISFGETINAVESEIEVPIEIDISALMQGDDTRDKTNEDLKNILISKIDKITMNEYEKSNVIKSGMPTDIISLLQMENVEYEIMCATESEANKVDEVKEDVTMTKPVKAKKVKYNTSKSLTNVNTEFQQESDNQQDIQQLKDPNHKHQVIKVSSFATASSEVLDNPNSVKHNNKVEVLSDESDADDFPDGRVHILGSLNDTITRIKEINEENKLKQYQCTLCLQNYNELSGVLLHTIDNHVPSTGPFFCVVCEKDCDSRKELRAHAKTHTGNLPYSCFICSKAYSSKRYLKRHMVCHTDFPKYRCPKCAKRFKVKSELESHIAIHAEGVPYACSQCSRVFNHKGNYKRHLISHLDPQGLHLPKYPCHTCGKRFLNNRTLETHVRVHTGEKPFTCDTCKKSFSQQGNLINHMRIHQNPRSYTCETCGKRFNQRATLRDHSLLHTGEKPYVCNVCGYAFTFSAALRRHMWTHATGKPFGCDVCNARFVGKYDLRRHMRIHNDRPPRGKRKPNISKDEDTNNTLELTIKEENSISIVDEAVTDLVGVQQNLLNQDVRPIVQQEESEKENIDALLNLLQYG
ncbi:zinc finger protein 665-like [Prorops nasuta]|uniref:zinc finger protein 665-like n=1 Tax=Prorops nasuta TaxID=863751 RepID=UPI0034CF7F85